MGIDKIWLIQRLAPKAFTISTRIQKKNQVKAIFWPILIIKVGNTTQCFIYTG